jgi:LacI family transcriptional regulator
MEETFTNRRRPTMREVAALAGVSLATVSRVLSGDERVAADRAERVRDAVRLLGYRRDEAASNLRRADRVSAIVGLVFEDVANPFQAAVLRSIESAVRERGMLTLVGSSDADADRERELAEAFFSRRVDGLVVVPAGEDQSYLRADRDAGVGIVFVDRPPSLLAADAVVSDNAGGTAAATDHLVAQGHRRIGFLGDAQRIFTAAERLRGHREALARHGLPDDPGLRRLELHGPEPAARATDALLALDDPPTALITAQNLITIGAVGALRAAGRHRDVALIGFDDLVLADALEPALTVVAQDPVALGRSTAELLLARMDGDDAPPRRIEVPTRLIERGSGELMAA